MTQEQKGYEQKYKEALGWMQSLYKGLHGATKEDAEHYFPELKEDEDEKIRKRLIKTFGSMVKEQWGGIAIEDILAWLEKQGEHKPIKASYTTIVETGDGGINALVKRDLFTDGCYDEKNPSDKVEPKTLNADKVIANMDEDSLARTREKMERITEDYCSYELAKLLKEKGFDGFCVACYNRDGDFRTIYDDTLGEIGLENWNALTEQDYKRMGLASWYGSISAPTHQMAMKWLREKGVYLNIRIALNRMEDDVINNIHWVVDILDFNSGEWKDNDIWTDTYEEAVEAALKYSLKNLI